MLLELRRSGGFTGTRHEWRVDTGQAGDDAEWRSLIDRSGVTNRRGKSLLRRLVWPGLGLPGPAHHDYAFELRIDGRKFSFRGVDANGPLGELVDRIMREDQKNPLASEPPSS